MKVISLLLLAFASMLFWRLTIVEEKDVKEYEAILQNAHQKKKNFFSQSQSSHVVKEMWLGDKNPLYLRISSAESELVLHQAKSLTFFEKMRDVTCHFQEKLYHEDGIPMQEIRYFQASKGVCNYSQKDFVGNDVTMKKYRAQGHSMPIFSFPNLTPNSTGLSEKVFLSLKKEGGFKVDMENMKTTFNPKNGI